MWLHVTMLPENRLPKIGSYVKFGNTSYWDEIFCKLPGDTDVVQVKLCMDKKKYLRKLLNDLTQLKHN